MTTTLTVTKRAEAQGGKGVLVVMSESAEKQTLVNGQAEEKKQQIPSGPRQGTKNHG